MEKGGMDDGAWWRWMMVYGGGGLWCMVEVDYGTHVWAILIGSAVGMRLHRYNLRPIIYIAYNSTLLPWT